ncbi:hypothetical protein ACHAXR_011546 [Thalassiosira sp. AJA248-18]
MKSRRSAPPIHRGLGTGGAVVDLDLSNSKFGVHGIQNMAPFLETLQHLESLNLASNTNIDTECFRILIKALHTGGSITRLRLYSCSIDAITVLEDYTISSLTALDLDGNNIKNISSLENYTHLGELCLEGNPIGRDGCMVVAKLLKESPLYELDLGSTNMGDDEAEILATSLKDNTDLETLNLTENNFTKRGYSAFLKLLNNVSSIERTYNSNHTLSDLNLSDSTDPTIRQIKNHIDSATNINSNGPRVSVGWTKVIEGQLQSETRKDLSRLQGIHYSYNSLFSQIEPILLPNVLALTGAKHGQSELYRMLIATVPDLASIINRKAVLKQNIAVRSERMATLAAEIDELNKELSSLESAEANQQRSSSFANENKCCRRKRSLDQVDK